MIEVNKTRIENEVLAMEIKKEIRNKMEQIDALKLSILRQEYDLYKLYSRLDDLDAEVTPVHTQYSISVSDTREKRKAYNSVRQVG